MEAFLYIYKIILNALFGGKASGHDSQIYILQIICLSAYNVYNIADMAIIYQIVWKYLDFIDKKI